MVCCILGSSRRLSTNASSSQKTRAGGSPPAAGHLPHVATRNGPRSSRLSHSFSHPLSVGFNKFFHTSSFLVPPEALMYNCSLARVNATYSRFTLSIASSQPSSSASRKKYDSLADFTLLNGSNESGQPSRRTSAHNSGAPTRNGQPHIGIITTRNSKPFDLWSVKSFTASIDSGSSIVRSDSFNPSYHSKKPRISTDSSRW